MKRSPPRTCHPDHFIAENVLECLIGRNSNGIRNQAEIYNSQDVIAFKPRGIFHKCSEKDGFVGSSLPATSLHRERQAFGYWDVFEYAAVVASVFAGISEDIVKFAREEKPTKQNHQEPLTLDTAWHNWIPGFYDS